MQEPLRNARLRGYVKKYFGLIFIFMLLSSISVRVLSISYFAHGLNFAAIFSLAREFAISSSIASFVVSLCIVLAVEAIQYVDRNVFVKRKRTLFMVCIAAMMICSFSVYIGVITDLMYCNIHSFVACLLISLILSIIVYVSSLRTRNSNSAPRMITVFILLVIVLSSLHIISYTAARNTFVVIEHESRAYAVIVVGRSKTIISPALYQYGKLNLNVSETQLLPSDIMHSDDLSRYLFTGVVELIR